MSDYFFLTNKILYINNKSIIYFKVKILNNLKFGGKSKLLNFIYEKVY